MKKTGKSLERLIASLERTLSHGKNIRIEAPKRLRDATTGRLREHDVLLTTTEGHHSVQIAIECRDRSRPVTVDHVEGFWAKCQDTGVHQGIIVSSTGFRKTARKKAEYRGIRCLSIDEVDSFPWLAAHGIHIFTRKIVDTDWAFLLDNEYSIDQTDFDIIDLHGNTVNRSVLTANAQQQLGRLLPDPPGSTTAGELKVKFGNNELMLRDRKSGKKVPISSILATIHYSVIEELIPFRMVQYNDRDKDKTITDAAVADLNIGECSVKFMIVYNNESGGYICLVPEDKT